MNQDTIKQLAVVRLFAGIDEQDIPHMLGCIEGMEHHYSKGEYIFMEGDDLKRIGLIISGTVQMIKEDVWGDKMILLNLVPGELFGESFVCNDKAASTVSFMATANCRILLLPFRRLLTTCGMACKFHQRLIENMVVVIADKNITMMNKMEVLSKKTIRERILVWLSQQAQTNGSLRFNAPMGRVALAEYLCVDRSALTRELHNMQRDGLLEFERNTFALKNTDVRAADKA